MFYKKEDERSKAVIGQAQALADSLDSNSNEHELKIPPIDTNLSADELITIGDVWKKQLERKSWRESDQLAIYQTAYAHYTTAIEKEPENDLAYLRRASLSLMLRDKYMEDLQSMRVSVHGRARKDLSPDFLQRLEMIGNLSGEFSKYFQRDCAIAADLNPEPWRSSSSAQTAPSSRSSSSLSSQSTQLAPVSRSATFPSQPLSLNASSIVASTSSSSASLSSSPSNKAPEAKML